MASNNIPTNKFQIPCPSNKENVEEPGDKRRRIGVGRMVIPQKIAANTRSKQTLSSVPVQSNRAGASDSLAGSETGSVCGTSSVIEFKSREDVDNLLNEKMMGKTKKDLKGTTDQNKQKMEYIKKLRACVKMFLKREDEYLLEKEGFLHTVESLEERIVEMDILAKTKQDELFTELEDIKKKHSTLQEICTKEEADKLTALESFSKHMYYISSKDETCVDCEKLGWKRLEEYDPSHSRWKYLCLLADGSAVMPQEGPFEDEDFGSDVDYYLSLPFAALFSCCKAKGLNVTCILSYCSEGDNISDSFQLAEAACKLLSLNPSEFSGSDNGGWLVPFSWSSVYGPPPDMTLF